MIIPTMKTLLFSLILLIGTSLVAQNATIMRGYDRSTIANLTISFSDQRDFEEKIMYGFRSLAEMPKYNISEVDIGDLHLPAERDVIYASGGPERSKAIQDRLRRLVADAGEFFAPTDSFGIVLGEVLVDKFNVGGKMMYEWAEKDKRTNTYPVIQARTLNDLSVEELKSNTDPAKTEVFAQCLRNNFVIVYDIQQSESNAKVSGAGISRVASSNGNLVPGTNNEESVTAIVNAFIYKVDIDDELFRTFVRPRFDDRAAIGQYKYGLTYIGRASVRSSFSPALVYSSMSAMNGFKQNGVMGLFKSKDASAGKTMDLTEADEEAQGYERNVKWDELPSEERDTFTMNELTRIAFEDVLNLIEMNVEDFKVRTPVMGEKPITAAVGRREGVRADQRYRVYENFLRNDSVKTRPIGIVRAVNRVADNMTARFDAEGNPLVSEFRQVYGGGIKEGMYMVQENDFGLGLSFGPTIGYFGSPLPHTIWKARAYYNSSRAINKLFGSEKIFGASGYIGLGLGSRKAEEGSGSYNAFIFEFGLEKKLYIHHKFDLVPEFGVMIYAPGESNGTSVEVYSKGAAYLAPGLKGLYKFTEKSAVVAGFHLPIQIAEIPYDNPAGFVHFDLRVRTQF